MLSKDYSAEFKQRFADRYADGATIAMLQHEFGLTKSTVKLWRERIDQGGVGAIDRPRKNNRYPQEFKLRVVGAYLRGEGDYKALALEHGVRNSAQIREWVKRYREGGEDALVVHPSGRRRKEPAGCLWQAKSQQNGLLHLSTLADTPLTIFPPSRASGRHPCDGSPR